MAKNPFGKPAANEDTFEIPMPSDSGVTIPNGQYEFRVTDFSAGTAKSSGNPQWILDCVIISGEHAGQDFRVFLSHSPAAAWKIAEALRALGFKQKTGEQVKFTKKDIVGRRFIGVVEEDTYNGATRSVIKNMLEHPKGAFTKGTLAATSATREEEEEDEEEEEVKRPVRTKPTAKKSAPPVVEEEEEEEDIEEDEDDFEDDEDEEFDEDFEDDEDEDDEDDDDIDEDFDEDEEEEEDDEEEEPVKPTPAKKAPAKKAPAKKAPAKKAPAKKAPNKRR